MNVNVKREAFIMSASRFTFHVLRIGKGPAQIGLTQEIAFQEARPGDTGRRHHFT
jgi:hypothetical protein